MLDDPIKKILNSQDATCSKLPPLGTEDVYPSFPRPPHVSSSKSGSGTVTIPTIEQLYPNSLVATTITSKLQSFMIVSGIIYTAWGLAILSLEFFIAFESHFTNYRSIWPGSLIVCAGVKMSITACRIHYSVDNLSKYFYTALVCSFFGILLSGANISTSQKCGDSSHLTTCDNLQVAISKTCSLALTMFAIIHALINLAVMKSEPKEVEIESKL